MLLRLTKKEKKIHDSDERIKEKKIVMQTIKLKRKNSEPEAGEAILPLSPSFLYFYYYV